MVAHHGAVSNSLYVFTNAPQSSMTSSVLFTLETDDCHSRQTSPNIIIKYSDDTAIGDLFCSDQVCDSVVADVINTDRRTYYFIISRAAPFKNLAIDSECVRRAK